MKWILSLVIGLSAAWIIEAQSGCSTVCGDNERGVSCDSGLVRCQCNYGWYGDYCNTQSAPIAVALTCDNHVWAYADGMEMVGTSTSPSANHWTHTDVVFITPDTKVFGIKCKDVGGQVGILASFTTGLVTDGTWSCTSVAQTDANWATAGFVEDSSWATPKMFGTHGVGPWKILPVIAANAKWIWAAGSGSYSTSYCRYVL